MVLKRLIQLLVLLFFTSPCFAQNTINGTWEGQFFQSATDLGQPRLVVEIYDFKDSLFTGVSHLYYKENKYEHYKIIGWYDRNDSLLVFREWATIAVDLGPYYNCLGTYKTKLGTGTGYLYQSGIWDPNITGCSFSTQIWLQKNIPVIKKPALKRATPAPARPVQRNPPVTLKGRTLTPAPVPVPLPEHPIVNSGPVKRTVPTIQPAKIIQRSTDIQSLIEIASAEKDSIKVDVYDNGEIDGDSVSVFEDNKLRVDKRMITAKPITFYISLDKNVNPIAHLRLVAESLGSIPPCTALMIVTTRTKRYEVHLSSNFSKNATVELFLKE